MKKPFSNEVLWDKIYPSINSININNIAYRHNDHIF